MHGEAESAPLNEVPHVGHSPEQVHNKSGQRIERSFGQFHAQNLDYLGAPGQTINLAPVPALDELRRFAIVFVADLAHEFLDGVFQCDDAIGTTVFVHDDGKMFVRAAQLPQRLQHGLARGKEHDGPHEIAHHLHIGGRQQKIADVDEADNVVVRNTLSHRIT